MLGYGSKKIEVQSLNFDLKGQEYSQKGFKLEGYVKNATSMPQCDGLRALEKLEKNPEGF